MFFAFEMVFRFTVFSLHVPSRQRVLEAVAFGREVAHVELQLTSLESWLGHPALSYESTVSIDAETDEGDCPVTLPKADAFARVRAQVARARDYGEQMQGLVVFRDRHHVLPVVSQGDADLGA